jgi:2-methylcitrate dehydratase PrpD
MDIRGHYARGWHATSTLGVLSATAACCRLLKASVPVAQTAIGMAASFASGSRQNFGTLTKSLHAGRAAESAVLAATLASLGGTSDREQLEGRHGFFSLFGSLDGPAASAQHVGRGAGIKYGLTVKAYPCCYQVHRAVDAALALSGQVPIDDICAVAVTVHPGSSGSLIHHRPRTGMQAKFSAEYTVAAALLDGMINLQSFDLQQVARPEAQALLEKVTMLESPTPPAGHSHWRSGYAVVKVTRRDGSTIEHRVDVPTGDPAHPLPGEALRRKFQDCFVYAGLRTSADETLRRLEALPTTARVIDLLGAIAGEARRGSVSDGLGGVPGTTSASASTESSTAGVESVGQHPSPA